MIRNEKTYGFFRKTKKYGLVGCISFCGILVYGLTDNNQIVNKQAHAAVVKGGADIVDADVHNKETSGVAMTYTSFDSNGSKQVASGSGVFVAPNVMVTVAHNYLDKDKASGSGYVRGGNSAQSYVVMNSDTEKRNNTPATGTSDIIPKGNIYYYNQKEFAKSYENDLAAVVTERPVEAMTNGEDKPREIGVANQGDNITLVGYPNDFSSKRLSEATKARLKDGKMYKISGTLSSLNTTTGDGTYNTSALGGFSGGPIFNDKGEVVGIHQHGTNTDAGTDAEQHGGGLFFTDKHRSWINKMIEEHGIKGWFVSGNDKYYYDDNHRALVSTEREIDGARYSFDGNGRGRLLSGTEKGKVVLRIKNEAGEKLVERVVAQGNVGSAVNYDFKQDKENKELFGKNPNATIVSIDGEKINKKFNENWSKDFVSKLSLGNTYIDAVIKGENFVRTQPGKVDTSGNVTLPKPSDEVKNAPNGLRNFDATAIIVTPDGTGSGTLIEKDLLLTVAHNFLKFENGKVTEKATGNNDKKYYAALPNGSKKVFFTDSDIHYWKKDDSVVGFTHDLALVKLKEVVDNVTPAAVKKDVSVVNSGDKVSVYGFPDGKLKPVIDTKVTDVVDRGSGLTGIGYTGTKPGASGGGLYNDKGEIIGVHQNGVVGQRSGGLVFSKEQLDWVKSYIDGKPKEPVYREEENVDYGDVAEFELKDLKDDSKLKQWFSDRVKKIGTEDKIRLSVDGNILFEKKIGTATKEDFEIKTGLYKIESIVEKEEKIPFSTKYVADEELTKGKKSVIKKGIDGIIKTTYIKDEDGNLTLDKETKEPAVDQVVKVGVKSVENTKEILSNTVYVADKEKARGLSNERIEGSNGYEKEVIKYTLNEKDGTISETVEKTEKKATDTIIKVPAKDKVEVTEIPSTVRYEKDSTREKGQNKITIPGQKGTRKVTTTYEVNPKTGEVTEKVGKPEVTEATETVVKVATKDKVEVTEIPSPVRYEKDSTREKGQNNITIPGEKGTRKVTTTYEVNPKTGEVTEKVEKPEVKEAIETVVKVAAKDKVEVTEIPSPVRYEKDSTRDVGQDNITVLGQKGTRKVTTTYEVNPKTGEVTQRVGTPEVKEVTETVVKVAAKDKIEVTEIPSPVRYEKDSTSDVGQDNITVLGQKGTRKVTTTYEVNPKTGEVTEKVETPEVKEATETVVKVAVKDKVEVTEIPSPVRYEKDSTREKGQNNITIPGEKGTRKVTTMYEVNPKTGEVTQRVGTPEVKNATETVVKVAAKDKIEVVQRENGKKVKVTTIYTVDVKTGNTTQTEREEEIFSEVITSKSEEKVPTIELKPYEGGVNPAESVVTEELKPYEGGVNPVESVVTEELNPFEGGVNPVESVVTEELNPFEGGVNPVESVVTEELKSFEGGVNPVESVVTEELKPFEGGVNPSESVVTEELKPFEGGVNVEIPAVKEELSELKLALLKDEEGNILDVLAISEKPKELSGYKYTGKEKVDNEGNKIYIYQKDNSEVVTSKSDEKVPTIELKPFEGGVNPEESVVTEELKPFEGGVNPEESVVTEELKPFEGGVNPVETVVTEELKPFEGGVNPVETVVTEELKPFEGGVNPEESVVTEELKPFEDGEIPAVKEELPELKLALLKDEEGNILDVLAISEKPKELSGYKYTGKEKLDSEGNKIYIYQKVELENINNKKQDTIVVNQSQVLKENIESKTEITTDKNDKKIVDKKLPNTGETPLENGLLGGMLLAATMMLAKRKVKK
ncbi:MAG: trypsin-like serine protease [Gemella sp.]|nr:MAG: trypsin-like serine protease [Gemella sp.]